MGTCSTLTTLPPFPCPRSASFLRSSFFKSSCLKSNFASVLEIVACIALRRPVAGLSAGIAGSRTKPFVAASPPSGGGRFFAPGAGAGRVATGSIDSGGGTMGSSGSLRDLKFRFVRKGVEEGVYPKAEVDIVFRWSGKG